MTDTHQHAQSHDAGRVLARSTASVASALAAGDTPACPYRPARDRLDDEARHVYAAIEEGLRGHRARIELPRVRVQTARPTSKPRMWPRPAGSPDKEADELRRLVEDILREVPDVWCTRMQTERRVAGFGPAIMAPCSRTLVPVYPESARAAASLRRCMHERAVAALAACAAPSDHGRALRLHDWLATHVVYRPDAPYAHDAPGALVNGAAVCDGIAKAYKYLCDAAGIPCAVVRGRDATQGGPHAWNLIYAAGRWTHVDVTADLPEGMTGGVARQSPGPSPDAPSGGLPSELPSRAFFGLSDAEVRVSNVPDPDVPLPSCPTDLGFFASFDLLARSRPELARILDQQLTQGASHFEVKLAPAAPDGMEAVRRTLEEVAGNRGVAARFALSQRRPDVVGVHVIPTPG